MSKSLSLVHHQSGAILLVLNRSDHPSRVIANLAVDGSYDPAILKEHDAVIQDMITTYNNKYNQQGQVLEETPLPNNVRRFP